jgi:(1->4)-alpha-D-glucan 1-alpha-D-glucosylmutase
MTPGAPSSTYRLQLTPKFGFAQAAETAEYLADLGVTHAYLSPILEAVPGSQHGYDVTDHTRIRAELGGEEGFRALAKRLRGQGLGIILDIVPNHMAVPADTSLNRQLWSVLRDGRDSPSASWFDIDWAAQDDRMLLPVLGGPVESCLADLRVEPSGGSGSNTGGEPVLRYFDQVLPLSPGTARLPMRDLLEAQHYRLAWWRDASASLNWRRFFDIATLIGVRVEDPDVFDATHKLILGLVAEGLVDGLRVDHPDGLADPRGYLRRLAAATGGAWVVVEKILAADEALPGDWPCSGTTGYDALRAVDGLFLDPAGADALSAEYVTFSANTGDERLAARFAEVAAQAKREIANGSLAAEVIRLTRLLDAISPGAAQDDVHTVLTEVLAAFPVYRAYVYPGEEPAAQAQAAIAAAVDGARQHLPRRLRGLVADLGAAVMGTHRPVGGAAGQSGEFVVRFQQTTGPVQAKGVEDTAAYRWPRLISLNEVGNDPDRFGVAPQEFHAIARRLADDWPDTMTTLSTHDTKRQEDVRARLAVLAELPREWGAQVEDWHKRVVSLRSLGTGPSTTGRSTTGAPAVDPETEYLIWQTIVGAWPISGARLTAYLTKAVREAKRRTSWTEPDQEYEAAVLDLASRALDDPELVESIRRFIAGISGDAAINSLGAKLVQLTMPGIPDVYQGCEGLGLSLVDPDNRRDPGIAHLRSEVVELDADADARLYGELSNGYLGVLRAAKLLVTSRALRLRRERPEWFAGDYEPLAADGPAAEHAVVFRRGGQAVTVATRLPVGLRRGGSWRDTVITLGSGQPEGGQPGGQWADLLTGTVYEGPTVPLAELTSQFPVALLVPAED